MRIVVVTTSTAERDALLDGLWPVHGARLAPYAETRVAQCPAGTVVVVPAGDDGLAAAVTAAAVAANRAKPDLLVYAALGDEPAPSPTGDAVGYAARRHGVRSLEVRASTLPELHEAVAPLLVGES
jgi:CTP:molybdopterin cytidylyltransferase MocA